MIVTLSLVYVTSPVISRIRNVWDSGLQPLNYKKRTVTAFDGPRQPASSQGTKIKLKNTIWGFVPISAESPDLTLRLCPVRSSEIMTPNINDTFE